MVSDGEFRRRQDLLAKLMDESGLSALVVVGSADVTGTSRGRFQYVTDFEALNGTWFAMLVKGSGPVLFQPAYVGSAWAEEAARFDDVVVAIDQAKDISSLLREQVSGSGALGVVGWSDEIQLRDAQTLRQELPGWEIVDVTPEFDQVMAPKSPEEIGCLQETAAMFRAAFEAIAQELRPGVTERYVTSRAFAVIKEMGGTSGFLNVSRSRGIRPFHPPTAEEFVAGDLVGFDLEHRGPSHYGLEAACYFSIGSVEAQLLDRYAVQQEVFASGVEALRPEAAAGDVMEAMRKTAARYGLAMAGPTGQGPVQFHAHGVGLNFFEPPLIPSEQTVHLGAALALHPWTVPQEPGEMPLVCLDTVVVQENQSKPLVFEELSIIEV